MVSKIGFRLEEGYCIPSDSTAVSELPLGGVDTWTDCRAQCMVISECTAFEWSERATRGTKCILNFDEIATAAGKDVGSSCFIKVTAKISTRVYSDAVDNAMASECVALRAGRGCSLVGKLNTALLPRPTAPGTALPSGVPSGQSAAYNPSGRRTGPPRSAKAGR